MTDTARERIEMALMMATGAEIGTDNVLEFIWHLGIPESELAGLIAGTHRVVPVEPTEAMLQAPLGDDGNMLIEGRVYSGKKYESRQDLRPVIWRAMLAAAQPKEKADE